MWKKEPPTAKEVRARIVAHDEAWAWWRLDQWSKPEPRRLLPARPGIGDPGVYVSVSYGTGAVSWCGEFGGWCATPDEVSARDAEIAARDELLAEIADLLPHAGPEVIEHRDIPAQVARLATALAAEKARREAMGAALRGLRERIGDVMGDDFGDELTATIDRALDGAA